MSQEYRPPPAATSRARRWWPVAVPGLWALAVCVVMRPGAIVPPAEVPVALRGLVYDESDLPARALRGANAKTERPPGRLDEPVPVSRDELAKQLAGPPPPLADRYYLEYP